MGRADHLLVACVLAVGLNASVTAASLCASDLDRSGVVTGIDLAMLLGQWGACPASPPSPLGRGAGGEGGSPSCPADLDASGAVNGFDLGILLGAWGDCPPAATPPKIIYTPVAHEGDPAPGIPLPGVFYGPLLTPQIDAAGNVLFKSFLGAPGLGEVGNQAIFYGQPGNIQKLAWETDPAPDMPPGVTIKSLHSANQRIAETGQITFRADVTGPGIVPGVNDSVLYVGNPGQGVPMRKFLRTGDPAPGLPGLTLTTDAGTYFVVDTQSDNGTLLLNSVLAGPGVDQSNDIAWWTGTADNLQLVYREGMPAPGTPTGTVFTWFQPWSVNDAGQMAVLAGLAGPGITDDNDSGRWIGGPGSVGLFAWSGVAVPDAGPGMAIGLVYSTITCTNTPGDMNALVHLVGPGVTKDNQQALLIGPAGDPHMVAREGDVVLEAGKDVEIDSIGNSYTSAQRDVLYRIKLRGSGIDETNQWAMCFGPLEAPSISLRDGEAAPFFPDGTILTRVVAAASLAAMNDLSDVVLVTEVAGPTISETDKVVLWRRDSATELWYPLLRGGDQIDGRTVLLPTTGDLSGAFWQKTGGSDGYGLSLNDSGQFVVQIPFTDGTDGIFIVWQAPATK